MTLLEIRSLEVRYGGIRAVKGIDLHVAQGELVCLIGANGAGKSSTLRAIAGLARAAAGSIRFGDRDLSGVAAFRRARSGLVMVPEGRGVFSRLTVAENLDLGAYTRSDRGAIRQDLDMVLRLFPRLKERFRQIAGTLSGGEQQMLATGRALMAHPRLLLMDEPSMGLAPILVESIFDTLRQVNQEGTTILLVEQNAHMALQIANRGYVLQTGQIALAKSAEELQHDPMVRKVYLGID